MICDVIVQLCPLHPLLVRYLPEDYNPKNDLSKYVRENCNLQFGDPSDYTNEKCLDNLRRFYCEKEVQYNAKQQEFQELHEALRAPPPQMFLV